ncbi:hypothetical protein pb186bvf_015364 [Paramecium bursaria]
MSDFFMDVFFNGGLTESLILMTQLAFFQTTQSIICLHKFINKQIKTISKEKFLILSNLIMQCVLIF